MALESASMPTVQIKDVPDEIHQVLRRRAAARGQSQQEYLLDLLAEHARTLTIEEIYERAAQRSGGSLSFAQSAALIRAERDAR